MITLHSLLLFLHVAGAIVWVGGTAFMTAGTAWGRAQSPEASTLLARATTGIGGLVCIRPVQRALTRGEMAGSGRLLAFQVLNLALLVSVVAAMVVKPDW